MARERDPSNEWLWATPLTDEELAQARAEAIAKESQSIGGALDGYTCDTCPMAPRCSLAFDSYNTEGDCLYEK